MDIKKSMMIFVMGILLISFASAFEFDNVQKVLGVDGKAGYKNVEIKNAFGLGATLWSGELTKNTEFCSDNCLAEKTITLHSEGSLVDAIRFETILEDESRVQQTIRDWEIYYWGDVEVYAKEVCGLVGNKVECSRELLETYKGWVEYELGTELDAGTYEVKLEGKKKPSRTVDWIIKTQGEWIGEWAVWGEDTTITENLFSYFDFTYGSGLGNLINASHNLTGTYSINTSKSGLGDAMGFTHSQRVSIDNTDDILNQFNQVQSGEDMSMCFWINPYDITGTPRIMSKESGGDVWGIMQTAGGVQELFNGGSPIASNVNADEWSFVCWTKNSTNNCMWEAGEIDQCGVRGNPNAVTRAVFIGGNWDDFDYNGMVDEIGFWNISLNSSQISKLYNSGSGVLYPFSDGTITLNSPVNDWTSALFEVEFNCSSSVSTGASIIKLNFK